MPPSKRSTVAAWTSRTGRAGGLAKAALMACFIGNVVLCTDELAAQQVLVGRVGLRMGFLSHSTGIYQTSSDGNWVGVTRGESVGLSVVLWAPASWLGVGLSAERSLGTDLEERAEPGNLYRGHGGEPAPVSVVSATVRATATGGVVSPYLLAGLSVKRLGTSEAEVDVRAESTTKLGWHMGVGITLPIFSQRLSLEVVDHVHSERVWRPVSGAIPGFDYPSPPILRRHDVFVSLVVSFRVLGFAS